MVSCLLALSACSQTPITVYRDNPISIPKNLLLGPCEAVAAGDTVRSLAKGYVENTSCLAKYQLLLEKQKEYNNSVEALYDNTKK